MNSRITVMAAALALVKTAGADSMSNRVERAASRVTAMFPGKNPKDTRDLMRETAWAESYFGTYPKMHLNKNDLGPFQINRTGLQATQDVANHPKLKRKFEIIRKKTGLNWPAMQHKDMQDPLNGAIAARLLYSLRPESIPSTATGRADYWKRFYNSGEGAGTADIYLNRIKNLGPVVPRRR
jgi:hypothetical protein